MVLDAIKKSIDCVRLCVLLIDCVRKYIHIIVYTDRGLFYQTKSAKPVWKYTQNYVT